MHGVGIRNFLRQQSTPLFFDRAVRLVQGDVDHGYGYGQGYTPEATLACLFVLRPAADLQGSSDVPEIVGDIYFPLGTEILSDDRLRVTHLHGEAIVDPQIYHIQAGPATNHIHIHVEVSRVADGS